MRLVRCAAAAAALVLLGVSLSVAEPVGQDDKTVQSVSAPILDNILDGMRSNDYAKYSKDCDDTFKESMTEEVFVKATAQLKANLGDCLEKQYLGFLTKGQMTMALWKAKYSQADEDVLIKIVISKRSDRFIVTGLWFE
ncbi:MAG: DUF3887 domain-containing protein [Candidatus Omnitrophica bacterium]|nr:DUF3887 domain-containing protein [Candidatus Omnitrophota bacterium]